MSAVADRDELDVLLTVGVGVPSTEAVHVLLSDAEEVVVCVPLPVLVSLMVQLRLGTTLCVRLAVWLPLTEAVLEDVGDGARVGVHVREGVRESVRLPVVLDDGEMVVDAVLHVVVWVGVADALQLTVPPWVPLSV